MNVIVPRSAKSWDNGIYRLPEPVLGPCSIRREDLPLFCCKANSRCARGRLVAHLVSMWENVQRERGRFAQLRSPWRRRNLGGYIEFAERELAHYMKIWQTQLQTCTADYEDRLDKWTADKTAVMPACTCGS